MLQFKGTKAGLTNSESHIDADSDIGQIVEVQNESGFHRNFTPRQIHVRLDLLSRCVLI
jgi:hypothetical protein